MSKQKPSVLLDDIRTSIEKIQRYTAGLDEGSFLADEKTTNAVVRNLEIIGETARHQPKRNRLDAEFRRTDKGSVGKSIDPEEGASDSSSVGLHNPPPAPWQRTMVQRIVRNRKMTRIFMIGMLCGVMVAAAFTYVFAIPANNYHWQMEIWNRGGAAWTYDRNGHPGWKWMVEPIPDTPSPAMRTVVPPPNVKVSSERL